MEERLWLISIFELSELLHYRSQKNENAFVTFTFFSLHSLKFELFCVYSFRRKTTDKLTLLKIVNNTPIFFFEKIENDVINKKG